MSRRGPYSDIIRAREKKKRASGGAKNVEILKWRKKWKEAGPIRFAEEVLPCWPENPPHPELGRVPEFNILSIEQKIWLFDLWQGLFPVYAGYLLIAGRGSGKTYILSIYNCWRISCFDYWSCTHMGGSSGQSMKGKRYIDFWRMNVDELYYCLPRSVESTKEPPHISSRWGGIVYFPACSEAGARSPHVREVHIDEVCTAEGKSKEGAKAVAAARYQITGSPAPILGYISTAQYILGSFIVMLDNYEKLRYKKYRWSLAKYYDEKKWYVTDNDGNFILDKDDRKTPDWDLIDTVLFKDRVPEHWISNVWWETDRGIQNLRAGTIARKELTDDDWLVEILGGVSKGTGLMFSREDLDQCICTGTRYTDDNSECDECEPYTNKCPMMKKKKLNLAQISNRCAGVDFGDTASLTVSGEREKMVYVLYSDELVGQREDEILDWVDEKCKGLVVWTIFADPEERGNKQHLEDEGYSTPHLWAQGGGLKKRQYIKNYKRLIEQHRKFIPIKFWYLIQSLRQLSKDGKGGVRKHNDHSFDSDMYSNIDYDPDRPGDEFWGQVKETTIGIWPI